MHTWCMTVLVGCGDSSWCASSECSDDAGTHCSGEPIALPEKLAAGMLSSTCMILGSAAGNTDSR